MQIHHSSKIQTIKIQQIKMFSNWGVENRKKDVKKTREVQYEETGNGEAVVLSLLCIWRRVLGAAVPLVSLSFKPFLTDRLKTVFHSGYRNSPAQKTQTTSTITFQLFLSYCVLSSNSKPFSHDRHSAKFIPQCHRHPLKERSQPGCPELGDAWNATCRCQPAASVPRELCPAGPFVTENLARQERKALHEVHV